MKIPSDAVIADDKLTEYLLVPKPRNDKSQYLAQADFTQQNPQVLRKAIRLLVRQQEAFPQRSNEYGTFYDVPGDLIGPTGIHLPVVTISLHRRSDDIFQFVTLKPLRRRYDAH